MSLDVTFLLPNENISGGTKVVLEFANRLNARGHDVSVISPIVPPQICDLILETGPLSLFKKGIEVLQYRNGNDLNREIKSDTILGYQRILKNIAGSIPDSDIIFAPNWSTALVAERLPSSKGTPVHFVQGYEAWGVWNDEAAWEQARLLADNSAPSVYMPQVSPSGIQNELRKRRVDTALRSSITRLAVSKWIYDLLQEGLETSVHGIVPNGIDTDVFYPESSKSDSNKITILSQSRSQPFKGTQRAIEVFRQLKDKYDHLEFVMFGRDVGSIPDWINFKGWIKNDAKLRVLYSNSDIFISASTSDGWGLPSHEATACGTATIATNVGWRYGHDENAVSIVPTHDTGAIVKEADRLIQNPNERKELGRNGASYVKNNLSIEYSITKLEQSLREISANDYR